MQRSAIAGGEGPQEDKAARENQAGGGLPFRESTRTIIRNRAGSSKDPRDDISMPCLRNNFNYPRYTKKNTKSNARNSGERASYPSPPPCPFWPSTVALSFIDTRCTPSLPLSRSSLSPSPSAQVRSCWTGCNANGLPRTLFSDLSRAFARARVCVRTCVRAHMCMCASVIGNPGERTYLSTGNKLTSCRKLRECSVGRLAGGTGGDRWRAGVWETRFRRVEEQETLLRAASRNANSIGQNRKNFLFQIYYSWRRFL